MSIQLAKRLNAEIVSADSVQTCRDLNIGAGKVTVAETQGVPHHLLDMVDFDEEYNVSEYMEEALRVTEEILGRGKSVIVTGGSGYYLRWYLYGKPGSAAGTPETRAAAKALATDCIEFTDEAWEQLAKQEMGLDDAAFQHCSDLRSRRDVFRLCRALETITLNANKLPDKIEIIGREQPELLKYDFRCFFLNTDDRVWLWRSIEHRCENMIKQGLIKEVERLVARGFRPDSIRGRTIGYRQSMEFLSEICRLERTRLATGNEINVETERTLFTEYLDKFCGVSRRYLRRQLTFLRSESLYRWMAIPTVTEPEETIKIRQGRNIVKQRKRAQFYVLDSAWNGVVDNIVDLYNMPYDEYWADINHADTVEAQAQLRTAEGNDFKLAKRMRAHRPDYAVFSDAKRIDAYLHWQRRELKNYGPLLETNIDDVKYCK
jgi:tRNA dimethylallyltransferase